MKRSAVGVTNGNWRGAEMRDYVRDVSRSEPVPAPRCTYCGGDVEHNPMKHGVCYGCYQGLINEYQEAQKIAAALQPYFDDLKMGLLRLSYNPIEVINDHYNDTPLDETMAAELADDAHWIGTVSELERRRADILTALKDDPITMDEANELFRELAEIDITLQVHPSTSLNDRLAYGWRFVPEIKF